MKTRWFTLQRLSNAHFVLAVLFILQAFGFQMFGDIPRAILNTLWAFFCMFNSYRVSSDEFDDDDDE